MASFRNCPRNLINTRFSKRTQSEDDKFCSAIDRHFRPPDVVGLQVNRRTERSSLSNSFFGELALQTSVLSHRNGDGS